jgi:hypothetical protein
MALGEVDCHQTRCMVVSQKVSLNCESGSSSSTPCMRRQALWKVAAYWLSSSWWCAAASFWISLIIIMQAVVVLAVHSQSSRMSAASLACRQRTTHLAFSHFKPKRYFQQESSSVRKSSGSNNRQQFSLATATASSSNDAAAAAEQDDNVISFSSSSSSNRDLESIQTASLDLTNGYPINLNSPKQVSQAIFGGTTTQSTSRDILQMVAQGRIVQLDERSQKLAGLVLEYRQLFMAKAGAAARPTTTATVLTPSSVLSKKNSRSFSSVITLNGVEEEEEAFSATHDDLNIAATTTVATAFVSPYDLQVESLFTTTTSSSKTCKIHDYWKEPLLQLTRPTARSLVSQLNAKICPNGYDPLAATTTTFMDPLRSTTTTGGSGSSSSSSTTSMAGKKGSFLAFCREQKELYPDCVILVSAVVSSCNIWFG